MFYVYIYILINYLLFNITGWCILMQAKQEILFKEMGIE
jgi:hypothetical protein